MNINYEPQPWMKGVLIAAGLYSLLWGLLAAFVPQSMLSFLGIPVAAGVMPLWRCLGMIVGVYGTGYLIASTAPFRHWPITFVGLLGKVLEPVGILPAIVDESLPASLGWTLVLNDLVWWAPFTMILWGALRYRQALGSAYEMPEADDPVHEMRANTGEHLDELAGQSPQLVMFLRHAGCTFCREALSDLALQRERIEASGCGIVLVHLGKDSPEDDQFFERYGLGDLPRFSDPACRMYRQFGLDLGGFSQLFGLRVWIRGLMAGVINGHGLGAFRGNSFQMPGVYLYHNGTILGGYLHDRASDRPNYVELAQRTSAQNPSAVPV